MMTIGNARQTAFQGVNNNSKAGYLDTNMQMDSVSRNIQNQLANAQNKLQELSSNEDMTLEEKMKKRQEIQQEITNLNQQLRQHRIEQRKEQNSKDTSIDDMLGGSRNTGMANAGSRGNGLSKASMQAMISADSSMKQGQIQGSVATKMENRADILKAEIKQDAGSNTEAKEAELAEAEKKAMNATASQMSTLSNANHAMEEAKKADEANSRSESRDDMKDKADNKGQEDGEVSENKKSTEQDTYTQVDIRL